MASTPPPPPSRQSRKFTYQWVSRLNPKMQIAVLLISLLVLLVVFLGFLRIWIMPNNHASQMPDSTATLNDANALMDKYELEAGTKCSSGVDDYLRSISKYDFKWEEGSIFRFDHFRPKVSAPGVITMISSKAMLQNEFGAYKRIKIACDYDTQNKKVLGFSYSSVD